MVLKKRFPRLWGKSKLTCGRSKQITVVEEVGVEVERILRISTKFHTGFESTSSLISEENQILQVILLKQDELPGVDKVEMLQQRTSSRFSDQFCPMVS